MNAALVFCVLAFAICSEGNPISQADEAEAFEERDLSDDVDPNAPQPFSFQDNLKNQDKAASDLEGLGVPEEQSLRDDIPELNERSYVPDPELEERSLESSESQGAPVPDEQVDEPKAVQQLGEVIENERRAVEDDDPFEEEQRSVDDEPVIDGQNDVSDQLGEQEQAEKIEEIEPSERELVDQRASEDDIAMKRPIDLEPSEDQELTGDRANLYNKLETSDEDD